MTKDDIIRMAREAGLQWTPAYSLELERFAALVAASERERCARVLEDYERFGDTRDCVAAIRARGEK